MLKNLFTRVNPISSRDDLIAAWNKETSEPSTCANGGCACAMGSRCCGGNRQSRAPRKMPVPLPPAVEMIGIRDLWDSLSQRIAPFRAFSGSCAFPLFQRCSGSPFDAALARYLSLLTSRLSQLVKSIPTRARSPHPLHPWYPIHSPAGKRLVPGECQLLANRSSLQHSTRAV